MTISAEKKLGHQTAFKQGITSIAQCKQVQVPGYKRDEIEVTTLDSTIMDFIPGDPPEITAITVSGIWVSGLASQELLQTSVAARTNDTYSVVLSSLTVVRTATFTAYCTGVESDQIESKNPYTFTATFRPTSTITWS